MRTPLREYFSELSEVSSDKRPPEAKNLDCRSFGLCYKPGSDEFVGRIRDGKWVPASVEPLSAKDITNTGTPKAPSASPRPKVGTSPQTKKTEPKKGTVKNAELRPVDFVGSTNVVDAIKGKYDDADTGEQGQGTKASKAAEAAVVYTSNVLLEQYRGLSKNASIRGFLNKNKALIDETLDALMEMPGSKFTETWRENAFNQVVAIFGVIHDQYGKISSIAWDNNDGRQELLGTTAKDRHDPSDLYVKVEGYGVIGVSLKKDGNVFFSNEGLDSTISRMAMHSPDRETMSDLQGLNNYHKDLSNQEMRKLVKHFNANRIDLEREMLQLKRRNIRGADAEKYAPFFDKKGLLNDAFTDIIFNDKDIELGRKNQNSAPGKLARTSDAFSLFTKCMETLDPESVKSLRSVDRRTTQRLLGMISENPKISETVKKTLVDSMKIPAMLRENPFGDDAGVRRIISIYGSAAQDEYGNHKPVYVNQKVLKDTFGPDIVKDPSSVFYMDNAGDRACGIVRLRVKNGSPPPNFFYPTMASVSLRSRTKGKPATMEVKQHDAFTHSIKAKSPDPRKWSLSSIRVNAQNTLNFLEDRLADPTITDEETQALLGDVDFYSQLLSKK